MVDIASAFFVVILILVVIWLVFRFTKGFLLPLAIIGLTIGFGGFYLLSESLF